MKILSRLVTAGFMTLMGPAALWAQTPAPAPRAAVVVPSSCAPVNGLSFVCGVKDPEDLILIPGTKWLITSGMTDGGSVRLIDTDAKVARMFYTGEASQIHADKAAYPNCPGAPALATFNAHGIALRAARTAGTYTLYAVAHGPMEGIEIFTVDARGAVPALSWIGCVALPAGVRANSVATFSDGMLIVTGGGRPAPGAPPGQVMSGVWHWKAGEAAFQLYPNTNVDVPNGIEVSKDDKEFYLAAAGGEMIYVFSRTDTSKPLRQVATPLFNPDNLRWTGNQLIAAGLQHDEPACGGTRKDLTARGIVWQACRRGWKAAALDPVTMTWTVIGYGEPNPAYGALATAVPVGDTLWLSDYADDRVAYRPLPSASAPK